MPGGDLGEVIVERIRQLRDVPQFVHEDLDLAGFEVVRKLDDCLDLSRGVDHPATPCQLAVCLESLARKVGATVYQGVGPTDLPNVLFSGVALDRLAELDLDPARVCRGSVAPRLTLRGTNQGHRATGKNDEDRPHMAWRSQAAIRQVLHEIPLFEYQQDKDRSENRE